MDEIENKALSEEQLNDVSGGISVGDISLPDNITPTGVSLADAVGNALDQLAASMGQAMHNAIEAQQDTVRNSQRGTLGAD